MESHGGQVGIAFQQLRHGLLERIQPTRPSRSLLLRHTRSAIFMICQYPGDRLSVDSQHPGDAATRSAPVGQPDDLVTRFFVHGLSSSLSRSRLRAATAPASCASFRKRGDKIVRSPGGVRCGLGAPATPPCGLAGPAKLPRVSTPGFLLRSTADPTWPALHPSTAQALDEVFPECTPAGFARDIPAIGPRHRSVPCPTVLRGG